MNGIYVNVISQNPQLILWRHYTYY